MVFTVKSLSLDMAKNAAAAAEKKLMKKILKLPSPLWITMAI